MYLQMCILLPLQESLYLFFVQGMLDYDHVCSRDTPSVAAMVYPFRYLQNIILLNFHSLFLYSHSPFQWQSQTEILLGAEGGHDSWYVNEVHNELYQLW